VHRLSWLVRRHCQSAFKLATLWTQLYGRITIQLQVLPNTRSLQMYSSIQALAANFEHRIFELPVFPEKGTEPLVAEGSTAKSRIARSLRQREVMSLLEGTRGQCQ
jgi:hypothetical protein